MSEIDWTDEQKNVLGHDALKRPALVLAGPGTGKSTTVIALAQNAAESYGSGSVRLATFTRAATHELAAKLELDPDKAAPVTTLHAFALGLIRRNMQWNRLPTPIRIPDDWEADNLLHADIRVRLAGRWPTIRRQKVARLVREMAARFESLTEDLVVEANIEPDLRNGFIAEWQRQRAVFGYSLFAEMPWYAYEMLIDHPDVNLEGLRLLVVDEYQDLNACELRLVAALANQGVSIVGVGDDEQSIYSWRMAAPEGIRRFQADYENACRYELTEARRFGETLLDVSQRLIATSPNRDPDRTPLSAAEGADEGAFSYLRFADVEQEAEGIVRLVQHYRVKGIADERIAILTRSDYRGNWTSTVRELLEAKGVAIRSIEEAAQLLGAAEARLIIASARLLMDEQDDLAWWTLLELQYGCSSQYIRSIADSALTSGERFYQRLLRHQDTPPEGSTQSQNAVERAINSIAELKEEIRDIQEDASFLELCKTIAAVREFELDDALLNLLAEIEERLDEETHELTLTGVLSQLEPTAKALALEKGGLPLMTIASSKGLTFDVAITLGVEDENFSDENPHLHEELRRLLYVAMTRPRLACHLTMATERTGPTAFSFDGTPEYTRSRVAFLSAAGIEPEDGASYIGELLSSVRNPHSPA